MTVRTSSRAQRDTTRQGNARKPDAPTRNARRAPRFRARTVSE